MALFSLMIPGYAIPSAFAPSENCAGIIITELMYNPSGSQGSDFTNEWLEILNDGCADVDLSGWTIEDLEDVDPILPFDGGSTVLGKGEYALIIEGIGSRVLTNSAWDIAPGTRIFATDDRALVRQLNNDRDTITIRDSSGNVVDSVRYFGSDFSGCGNEANGKGFSLERVDPLGPGDCTNFRSTELQDQGFPIGGTPGSDNHLWIGSSCTCTNNPPECDKASPSKDSLWPPNHKFVDITVNGVTDPDGDTVTITITGIQQDEEVAGKGSGNTSPDGDGVGTNTAQVRAERSGTGDGRVYEISFSVDDGNGGMCLGSVSVGVPYDKKGTAVDSGQDFNSATS